MGAIAIIPARGGSVRIPRKNIREFHGKPIIAYSIETARQCGPFDGGVYVSTEDAEIASVARHYGAWVIDRPPELAEIGAPDCGTQEVTRHALVTLGITEGYACCIYPCAPTMLAADIGAVKICAVMDKWQHIYYVPGWCYWMTAERLLSEPKIQESDRAIDLVPHRRIDINTENDWLRAEQLYATLHNIECQHAYELKMTDPAEHPELSYFRCAKCGGTLPR